MPSLRKSQSFFGNKKKRLNYVALFFSSILLLPVCYSYLIYPVFIVIASKSKKNNTLQYDQDTLPKISILMAAHNEELILEKKLESIFSSNYPKEKIELIVGTDCCTDGTNQILEEKAKIQTKLKHVIFKEIIRN